MSLESSIEVLASALTAHADALKSLAAAIQAAPLSANCEHFEAQRLAASKSAAEKEAEALTTAPADAAKTAAKAAAPAGKAKASAAAASASESPKAAEEMADTWEPGGGADIEKGEPLKPGGDSFNGEKVKAGEDPEEPPFEMEKEQEPKPEAELGAEKTKQWQAEDARRFAIILLKKVPNGETLLRGLLDDIGVKKLKALNAEQINAFCENASKFAAEA